MDIGLLVRQHLQPLAGQDADRPAISLEQEPAWSYRELDAYANRCSHTLLARGVGPGDRVGLLLANGPEHVGLYLGTVRTGAVAVRLNWRLSAAELAFAVADAGCRVLLVHDDLTGLVDASTCAERIVVPRGAGDDPLRGASSEAPLVATPSSSDLAMIMYTSGTTGRPKGATWTHGASVMYAAMQVAAYGFDRSTVAMTTGPLFHVGSLENLALPALLAMAAHLAGPETQWLLPKGRSADAEVAEACRTWQGRFRLVPSLTDASAMIVEARAVRRKGQG